MSLALPTDPSGLLERAPRLAELLPDAALAEALARGDAWKVHALLMQRLAQERPGPTRELLAALVEDRGAFVTSAPTPRTPSFLGTGLRWKGQPAPTAPDAPFVAERTVTVLGLPVWPLNDYLVRGTPSAPLQVIGQVPPPARRAWRRAGVVGCVVLGLCVGVGLGGALLSLGQKHAVSVINGLSRPVVVRIGAQHWEVAPGVRVDGVVTLEKGEVPHGRASWPGSEWPFEDVVLPTAGDHIVYNVRGAATLEGQGPSASRTMGLLSRRPLPGSGSLLFPDEALVVAKADWESTVLGHMEAGRWQLAGQVASAVAEVEAGNVRARELGARSVLLADAQTHDHRPGDPRAKNTATFARMLMHQWQNDLGAQSLAQDLMASAGLGKEALERYYEHENAFRDQPLPALYLRRARTLEVLSSLALPEYESLAKRFPDSPDVGRALLEARWRKELEDPLASRELTWGPTRDFVRDTSSRLEAFAAKHPPETVEQLELFVRIHLRAWRKDAATALVHRFGQDPRHRSWDFLVLAGRLAEVVGPAHTPYVLRDWIPPAMTRQPERMLLLDLLTGRRMPKEEERLALKSPIDQTVLGLTRDTLEQPARAMEQAAKESDAVLSRMEPEVVALLALELTRTGDARGKRLFTTSLPLLFARDALLKYLHSGEVTPAFSRLAPDLRAGAVLVRARREAKEGYTVFTGRLDGFGGLDALQGFAVRAAPVWMKLAFDACMDTKVPHKHPEGVMVMLKGDLIQRWNQEENNREGRRPNCVARVVEPTGLPPPKDAPAAGTPAAGTPEAGNANGADP
ncbi:hypothetical protein D7Y13_14660 [Corallococcus praedator]|uniref:Uncharacterized protein n=1 Tax=Corallococcus praedator TaxID=2316724 RepID=A0ABX9QIZ0_9BACT|nr:MULTISPECIES: hypothetical protein [Corallococcus]RKH34315.1 hypothetical protein D7X75_08865 [Corallococcus sp. CA031C]RKI09287.1 hypothetical protein D7Y13_14660 [Corallococcus praedator]